MAIILREGYLLINVTKKETNILPKNPSFYELLPLGYGR